MEQTELLNSTHQVNILKKILLFINVAAFRVSKSIPSASSSSSNYNSRGFAIAVAAVTEYAFARYILQVNPLYNFRILLGGLCIHTVIDVFFIKDIIIMAGNFNAYYNKYLFYLFIVLVVFAFGGCLVIFNNEIGHVAPGTHWHYHGF